MVSLPTILLVEDDPGHARLFGIRMKRLNRDLEIVHVPGGREVLDYLKCENDYAGQTLPDRLMIVLDLNMPYFDGIQVLQELKKDKTLDLIPRIILTTSDEPDDIHKCEEYGFLGYVVKPPDYEEILSLITDYAQWSS